MFRNKIMVRAHKPSLSSPFLLIQLSLSDSSSPIQIETLCWKLSRRWSLVCFNPSPSAVFIIYQRAQTESAARAVKELTKTLAFTNVGEEEELSSASLIARAVECWFRAQMLENGWRCIGESTFVNSSFGGDEEKNHLQALNVRVQAEIDDGLVFLVSPDVIWFTRDKISDLVASPALQSFLDNSVTVIRKDSLFTSCTVLPSLYNGHILGLSKLPPVGEKFEMLEELWLIKHGLSLSSDYYINVHFRYGGQARKQWFPSAFILRSSGLYPAPQTIRSSMAANALEPFIKLLESWDFFSQGPLKVKEICCLTMQPIWKGVEAACEANKSIKSTHGSISDLCVTSQALQLTLDFRTQKPALGYFSAHGMLDHKEKHADGALTRDGVAETTSKCAVRPVNLKSANVLQTPVKLPPVCQSQTYPRESDQGNETNTIVKPASIATDVRDVCPDMIYLLKKFHIGCYKEESILLPRIMDNLLCSSKGVREEVMREKIFYPNCASKVQKVQSKEGRPEACKKTKANTCADISDITSKVFDFHASGKLQSLTVSDLKCFLASKKVKLGGKKEDLIQRATQLLG